MSALVSAGERRTIAAATHGRYRADIDGLRALAVLPVVFFHASVRGFSGGFVGVDVFFVISGYLITGILVRDIAVGRHSITEFYRRRILRIFPALAVMLLVTTIGACFFLLPPERYAFARSLAATALFASNLEFYATTDYFTLGATAQPLLHTWSLAVEEQWYIIWPVVLAAISAAQPRWQLGTAIAITLASFTLGLLWLPVDPAATFYLIPARGWELGLGAVVALTPPKARPRWVDEALGPAGVLLIATSVKLYTSETLFPGFAAIPPCLGAALVIVSGDRLPTLTARVLAWAPVKWVGRISYSLYLWHWPVIVYIETGLLLRPSPVVSTTMIAVSIALAWVSYRFVEQPFRQGVTGWSTPRVVAGGCAVIAATLALALAMPPIAGVLKRFTPADAAMARYLAFDGDSAYRRNTCFKVGPRGHFDAAACLTPAHGGKPVVLLVGDSHAAHFWPGLSRYLDLFDVLQATATGCTAGIYPAPRDPCQRLEQQVLHDWLPSHKVDRLILSSRWVNASLDPLAAALQDPAVRAAHPLVIGPMPEYAAGLPRLLVWADQRGDPNLVQRSLNASVIELDGRMRAMTAAAGVSYVSLVDLLCGAGRCRATTAGGAPMLWDHSHLTPSGSAELVDAMLVRGALNPIAPAHRRLRTDER